MNRFLQLHLLTVYPPANLNRDDTGRPKTAIFGGAPRLRVSSQSLKRGWRTSDVFATKLEGHLGKRTQRFGQEIESHLQAHGAAPEEARKIAREVADLFGEIKSEKDKNPTYVEQLAFVSPSERQTALKLAEPLAAGETIELKPETVLRPVDGAVDIAMFGRMLADDPDFNREAAVQAAKGPLDLPLESAVRRACRDLFRRTGLLERVIPTIEEMLLAGELPRLEAPADAQPVAFEDEELSGDAGHRG